MRRGARRALPALALALAAAASCGGKGGEIAGRAVHRGKGEPGITVEVYPQGDKRGGSSPFASTVSGPEGVFALALPAGEYWVWLKDLGATAGPRRLAEYPGNPVRLRAGERRDLGAVEIRAVGAGPEASAAADSGLRGRVLRDGRPVEDAAVMVYEVSRTRLAGPGYLALVRTDAEGRFQVDLPPDRYRVAVRLRQGGGATGFLREGDLSAGPAVDPVEVPDGGYRDLGDLSLHPVDAQRLSGEKERRFQQQSGTVLEGRVVGADGSPRAGQFVLVYRSEGMIGRPEQVTGSGEDGSFTVYLPGGGTYYLGARSSYGGPRKPGEWVGRLAGSPDGSLRVLEGRRVKGLTIVMEKTW